MRSQRFALAASARLRVHASRYNTSFAASARSWNYLAGVAESRWIERERVTVVVHEHQTVDLDGTDLDQTACRAIGLREAVIVGDAAQAYTGRQIREACEEWLLKLL